MAVVLFATAARAAEPAAIPRAPGAEVDRHASLGQRDLEHGQYQDAIAEFRRAYELRADPRFLFDIAEAYRLLRIVDRALFFYDRYLAAAPDAPDRDEVEAKVADLERTRARAASPPPVPSLARDVVITPVEERRPEAASSPPLWRRWWFWTAIGAAIVAGTVAAALAPRGGQPALPTTDLGDRRFY